MELIDLSFIIAVAERRQELREYCVLLNRATYTRLLRDLQNQWGHSIQPTRETMPPMPPRGATFEYYGRTISWTPALDNFPDGYVIGALWPGA